MESAVWTLADMYNPMYWIANKGRGISTFAEHILCPRRRAGSALPLCLSTVNYATALMNAGCDVDYHMQWSMGHGGGLRA